MVEGGEGGHQSLCYIYPGFPPPKKSDIHDIVEILLIIAQTKLCLS